MTDETRDPSLDLIEDTDNGLRPEDGDQLIDGAPVDDYSIEELMAIGEEVPDE